MLLFIIDCVQVMVFSLLKRKVLLCITVTAIYKTMLLTNFGINWFFDIRNVLLQKRKSIVKHDRDNLKSILCFIIIANIFNVRYC